MYLVKKIFYIFTLTLFISSWAHSSESTPFTVFVLGSGGSESTWTQSVSQGITASINQTNQPYVYFIDHLDAGRFDEQGQHDTMFRYLTTKFAQKTPDVFIAAGPAASNFSLLYPDLFPDSKRILIQPKQESVVDLNGAIIIDTKIGYSSMVKEALRLSEPDMVYIIGDSVKPSDLHRLDSISSELEKESVPYTYLDNRALFSLLKETSELPRNSAILFTPIYREHDGKGLRPIFVLEKLHEVARIPIFATSVSEVGFGSVGGYLHSPKELGMMAGEAIFKVVKSGEIAFSHDGIELIYDWNEVVRWGYQNTINQKADIRFRNPSIWKEYRDEFITFIFFLVVLTGLVVVLVISNGKLKKVRNALSMERGLLEKKVVERTKELSILHKKAEKMARIDVLTSINNRRAFFELGALIHNQTERSKLSYVIIMLDIDRFKNINDTYGHPAGDLIIQNVVKILMSIVRKSDVAARIGGDEFAVILTNSTCEQVHSMAEKIRVKVEETDIQLGELTMNATISMGCAEFQVEDRNINSVLAKADKALYHAKTKGRNTVAF